MMLIASPGAAVALFAGPGFSLCIPPILAMVSQLQAWDSNIYHVCSAYYATG